MSQLAMIDESVSHDKESQLFSSVSKKESQLFSSVSKRKVI